MSRVAQNLSPEGDASWPIVRNDIDVARFNRNALGDLGTRHTSSGGENVGQFALMFGVEVNNDNERGLNVVRQLSKNSCRARTHQLMSRSNVGNRLPPFPSAPVPAAGGAQASSFMEFVRASRWCGGTP